MRLSDLIPILQSSISPVILISGVGLILLSMTNRYSRIIDRSRALAEALRKAPQSEHQRFLAQLHVLSRRADMARAAITLATISVLLTAVLIISLFLSAFFHEEVVTLMAVLFVTCMASLITSLLFLLGEINLSLTALKVEIKSAHDSI